MDEHPDPQHPDPQHPDPQHPDPQHADPQHAVDGPRGPETDEAYARLRTADPAADARLDAAALRAEVARRAAAEPAGASTPGDPGPDAAPAPVTSLASRRRARWLQVAAAGAGVALVAGAGGYAVGASGDAPATTAAPAIVLGQGGSAQGAQGAEGAADSGSMSSEMRIGPGFGGRAVFSASGLPDDPTAGHAWALDGASVFSAETAARVAAVLGVTGDPRLEYGAWTVGSSDGTGPSLSLQPDGPASISYVDPTLDPWSCTASAPDTPDAGAGTEGSAEGSAADGSQAVEPSVDPQVVDPALPSAPVCDPAVGDAPAGDAATAAVRDLLVQLGVDPDGFEYELADTGTPRATTVLANQVVEGQRTGLSWNVTLAGGGVQSLYGWLAPLVDLGEYPVVGAATAVERLNDPRFGAGYGGVMPLARQGAADDLAAPVEPSADPTVPATPAAGAPIAWPVQQVTISGARLGLTLVYQGDGATLLVPAYELSGSDGSTWSVVAVDEEALDLAG